MDRKTYSGFVVSMFKAQGYPIKWVCGSHYWPKTGRLIPRQAVYECRRCGLMVRSLIQVISL